MTGISPPYGPNARGCGRSELPRQQPVTGNRPIPGRGMRWTEMPCPDGPFGYERSPRTREALTCVLIGCSACRVIPHAGGHRLANRRWRFASPRLRAAAGQIKSTQRVLAAGHVAWAPDVARWRVNSQPSHTQRAFQPGGVLGRWVCCGVVKGRVPRSPGELASLLPQLYPTAPPPPPWPFAALPRQREHGQGGQWRPTDLRRPGSPSSARVVDKPQTSRERRSPSTKRHTGAVSDNSGALWLHTDRRAGLSET